MKTYSTQEIMDIALEMAGFTDLPGDSAIYNPGTNIRKILFGIDISTAELHMAKMMDYDLVIAHHPPALGCLPAHTVYGRHAEFMIERGINPALAWASVKPRMEDLASRYSSANHDHYPSIARFLDLPFMNIHAPLDELGRQKMQEVVDETLAHNHQATLGHIAAALNTLPEFQRAFTKVAFAAGRSDTPAGKTIVAHGALTNGGYEVANTWLENGFDTVIYIHCPLAVQKRIAKENKGNLLISGHIVSDLVGINPFVRKLRDLGLEVTGISGIRI